MKAMDKPLGTEIDADGLEDIQSSFCHYVHVFVSEEAGRTWVGDHPGTFLLTLQQGFQLGQAKNRAQFGESP